MHLHVSIALLFSLLNEGFSLDDNIFDYNYNYNLSDYNDYESDLTFNRKMRCYDEESRYASSRRVEYMAGRKHETIKEECVRASECNSWSITATPIRIEHSVQCCDTDMCNDSPAPDLNSQPNGKKCYSCNWEGCSQTVGCLGNENHCFIANSLFPHSSVMMKGCASEFACGSSGRMFGPHTNVTCCEGNLCNAVERVSQSFLFLCCSLMFYFLLN